MAFVRTKEANTLTVDLDFFGHKYSQTFGEVAKT
jgi:hypothetical protein